MEMADLLNKNIILEERLRDLITDIGDFNFRSFADNDNSGLFDGHAGIALFLYELFKYSKDDKHLEDSVFFFAKAYNGLSKTNFNLSHGASGVMWLMNYFVREKIIPAKFEQYLNSYDNFLGQIIERYRGNIDPMHGLLSIANYYFFRGKDSNFKYLSTILSIIDEAKENVSRGALWRSNTHDAIRGKIQNINFGYAHGILAVLYFLSKYVQSNIEYKKSQEILDAGLSYFLSYRDLEKFNQFPMIIDREVVVDTGKVGYCYGDLGIACGLAIVGKNTECFSLLNLAKELANSAANNALRSIEGITDIGLCHGAAGNGYMFQKLFNQFEDDTLLTAAESQYEKLLSLRQEGTGICGFTAIDYNKELAKFYRRSNVGFIEGIAGVGLSILSYLTKDGKSDWDKILYLS